MHALFGRRVLRWWDVVGGVRQDVQPGDAQTWVAAGIQGIAPYWFDIDVFGYVGAFGRTQARVEAKYELLITNRLVLQPLVGDRYFGHVRSGTRPRRRAHGHERRPASSATSSDVKSRRTSA